MADLTGKFLFNERGSFAANMDMDFRAYADFSQVDTGNFEIAFLTDVLSVDANTASPITVSGLLQMKFFDGDQEITNPSETNTGDSLQFIISGKAEFSALGYFTATIEGTATVTFTSTEMTFDLNGMVSATYLGEIGHLAGNFTVTYATPTSINLWGAAELTTASGSDSAFSKLEALGITASGKAWFFVNTAAEDK